MPVTDLAGQVAPPEGVGIDERSGGRIPATAAFKDQDGNLVTLAKYFDGSHPVVIAPVYFSCPNLCNLVLNGLLDAVLREKKFIPGKDYTILSYSINPEETIQLAQAKRKSYVEKFPDDVTKDIRKGWHFLTGSQQDIDALSKALGFYYKKDGEDYLHPAVIIFLTPDGRISRYLYGVDYPDSDYRLALLEAAQGKIGDVIDSVLMYCYSYDPVTKRYNILAWRVMRIGSIGLAILFLIALGIVGYRYRKKGK